jgi:GAF domain-containing protein
MKCPRCQQDNPTQAKFCLECGTPVERLQESAKAAPSYPDVQRSLTESLEQQTATREILRIISNSPTELRPVFDVVAESAARLCQASDASIMRVEGDTLRLVAHHGPIAVGPVGEFTMPLGRGTAGGRAALLGRTVHITDIQAEAEEFPEGSKNARRMGHRTILVVPLMREGVAIGSLGLRRTEARPFTDRQIALLQTFADQAVIAIENVRLFKELEEKNSALTAAHAQVTEALGQQTATSEILRVISRSPTDVQPVFDAIVRAAVRLCGGYFGVVTRYDGHVVTFVAEHNIPAEAMQQVAAIYPGPPNPDTITGRVLLSRTIVHEHDVRHSTLSSAASIGEAGGYRTIIGVPMLRDGEPIGTISVARREVEPFSGPEILLLQTFADQAVIAIENVRLFTELQEKNKALTQAHAQVTESLEQQTATSEILRVIASSPTDVEPVFDTIAASASRLCGGVAAIVTRFDGEMIDLVAHHNPRPGIEPVTARLYPRRPGLDTTAGRAVLECSIVHIPDAENDPDLAPNLARDVRAGSFLAVPMLRDGRPIGAISVSRAETGAFPADQVELLKTFADQAVIAIENVRLFTELQEKNKALTRAHAQVTESLEQQTATSEILRVIASSPTDVEPVFNAIVESATQLSGARVGHLFRFDGQLLHLVAQHNSTPDYDEVLERLYPMPASRGQVSGRAILSRTVVQIPDVLTDPEYRPDVALAGSWRSRLAVPLLRDSSPIGVIVINRTEPGSFADSHIELLKTFADQAVIAIENVRLFRELEARTAELTRSVNELTALGEVSRALSSTLDLERVLQTIVTRASQLAGTDACSVFEYDEATEAFHLRATNNLDEEVVTVARQTPTRKGEGVQGRMALTRQPVQVPDIAEEDAYRGPLRDILLRTGTRAVLAIPMLRENELIGGLTVNKHTPGEFSPEVIELLTTFATQCALAVQNARLFREIEQKGRELEAASRHKSEFLANMSHELRTPLNAIIGFSEVLGERMFGELNEKQDEYLKDIHASGQHLLSLINDILDLSKIEAGKMELELSDFDLPMTIDNALTLVRERAARRSIELHSTVDERLGQIQADERKIRQVLLNLLSNAIKFTPEGGRIEVGAKPVDGSIEVSVTDTGVGIAPEDQDAVFEEFRQVGTADKKVEGTGLGLALSRKFIELHGGKIWVQSQIGAGSTFTFTLPVRRGE